MATIIIPMWEPVDLSRVLADISWELIPNLNFHLLCCQLDIHMPIIMMKSFYSTNIIILNAFYNSSNLNINRTPGMVAYVQPLFN